MRRPSIDFEAVRRVASQRLAPGTHPARVARDISFESGRVASISMVICATFVLRRPLARSGISSGTIPRRIDDDRGGVSSAVTVHRMSS